MVWPAGFLLTIWIVIVFISRSLCSLLKVLICFRFVGMWLNPRCTLLIHSLPPASWMSCRTCVSVVCRVIWIELVCSVVDWTFVRRIVRVLAVCPLVTLGLRHWVSAWISTTSGWATSPTSTWHQFFLLRTYNEFFNGVSRFSDSRYSAHCWVMYLVALPDPSFRLESWSVSYTHLTLPTICSV